MSHPKPKGAPTLTIIAEQLYDNGHVHTHHIRVDVFLLLQSNVPAVLLEAAAYEALASIGVKP